MQHTQAALLLLADGTLLKGQAIGAIGTTVGELCFNTGMTGYQEIYTDPSYFGQIIVTTHTHIGNYGVLPAEAESSSVKIAGLVVKNYTEVYSRATANQSLQEYLVAHNISGIAGIDTRALVRHIRARGAMNAIISSNILDQNLLREQLAACPPMNGLELSSRVSTQAAYDYSTGSQRVAVLDYGVKQNILGSLARRGCQVRVFPHTATTADLLAWQPQGVLLSNGPGDPAAMPQAVTVVQELLRTELSIFGICLGHQLLAEALGAKTYKMPYGHRGINHPVQNLITGRSEITSQNHGFAVQPDSLANLKDVVITHRNLNDGSNEGLRVQGRSKAAFSVQYHPEANPGPHDSAYLFDDFVAAL